MAWLIISLIFGFITAAIASNKGRSGVGWFFIGFFFGLIGLIIALVASNLHEQREFHRHQRQENRRVREQLRQERAKNDVFRRHVHGRLDTHDRMLGTDTRQAARPLLGGQPRHQLEAGNGNGGAPPPLPGRTREEWHYELDGESVGPVSKTVLRQMLREGELRGSTLVWREGMGEWRPARQVEELVGRRRSQA